MSKCFFKKSNIEEKLNKINRQKLLVLYKKNIKNISAIKKEWPIYKI